MKKSAGLLIYRMVMSEPEVLLVHPGGPYWKNKNEKSWSIPKGEFSNNEIPLDAAICETLEETGFLIQGKFIELDPIKQRSGKVVYAWAVQNDPDLTNFQSNTFEMEWPPRSKKLLSFPEADRAEWFNINEASLKIVEGQSGFLKQLVQFLK